MEGKPVLTRTKRGDAVRAKLAVLGLGEGGVTDAVRWARAVATPEQAAVPAGGHVTTRGSAKPGAKKRLRRP